MVFEEIKKDNEQNKINNGQEEVKEKDIEELSRETEDYDKSGAEKNEVSESEIEDLEKQLHKEAENALTYSKELETMTKDEELPANYESIKDKLTEKLSSLQESWNNIKERMITIGLAGVAAVGTSDIGIEMYNAATQGVRNEIGSTETLTTIAAVAAITGIGYAIAKWKNNLDQKSVRKKIEAIG